MSERVFVTGIGIISSIGVNARDTAVSLTGSKSGIGKITLLDTRYKDEIPAAEVSLTDADLKDLAEIISASQLSRTSLLGIIAARQAMSDSGIRNTGEFRTGLISATSVGGMDRSEKFYADYIRNGSSGRLRDIITHDCGDCTQHIAASAGISYYLTTISTACSSSANAIMFGSRLIKNNILDRVLVGGSDCLTDFTINGFCSLMIVDKTGCKPFDEERNGLTLGEGAAFLMLESEKCTRLAGKKPLCEIKGFGNVCDAFHQTASSPEGAGAFRAMQKALEKAGIEPCSIDYVNAHGTATKNNDLSEGRAIKSLFGNKIPPFSSTKSFTGHTLGAAGAIEAVFCVMALKNNWIYPNLNFRVEMTDPGISPVREFRTGTKLQYVMSNSFGFGGNNTSLIFSAC
jgi:3-oxoacyl-(acyl-carrier-protein) synthase